MYVKTVCPYCKNPSAHSITVHCRDTSESTEEVCATQYIIENISIDETIIAEELVQSVLYNVYGYIRDGIEVRELCQILKRYYGIAAAFCCDFIQRIKIELDMYSPDKRHLYFVRA